MLNGKEIERVENYKYLGLILDEGLTWRPHISMLCSKLASVSGAICALKSFLPKPVLMKIYFALGHSRLTYLTGAWGSANKSDLKELQVLQKRCLKHAQKLPQRYPTIELFQNQCSNVLNIESLFKQSTCCFVHGVVKGTSHNAVRFERTVHSHYTRERPLLKIVKSRTKKGERAISTFGIKLYNSLPEQITSLQPVLFRKKLKEWLSKNQYPGKGNQ